MTGRTKHLTDRIAFIAIILIGIALFFYFNYNRAAQLFVIFGMVTFYLMWGILHHIKDKNLDLELFLEYLAITIIAVILIFSGI